MAASSAVHLIFHELGTESRPYSYYVPVERFREYIQEAKKIGGDPCFTFDDGHDSGRAYALPMLAAAGMHAKFFLVAGWIESRPHFMNWAGVRELVAQGQEVGSHGWSHALLTRCGDSELRDELERSKKTIEQRIGRSVDSISIPGGRWDSRVLRGVMEAGYLRVYTSDPFLVETRGSLSICGRINVTQKMSSADLRRILKGDFLFVAAMRAKHAGKACLRRALGEQAYHRLWSLLTGFADDDGYEPR